MRIAAFVALRDPLARDRPCERPLRLYTCFGGTRPEAVFHTSPEQTFDGVMTKVYDRGADIDSVKRHRGG